MSRSTSPGRQTLHVPGKVAEGLRLIAVSPAAVDVHHVGPHPPGDLGLVLQFPDGCFHHFRTEGVHNDELVGMETGPQVGLYCERPALLETTDDFVAVGKLLNPVAML